MTLDPAPLTGMSASGILFSDKSDAGAVVPKKKITPEQRARYNARDNLSRAKRLSDPEYRALQNSKKRAAAAKKKLSDPGYAAGYNASQATYRSANKEKYAPARCEYRERNRQKLRAENKSAFAALPTVRRMLRAARRRSLEKGVPFQLAETDVHLPEKCPVLGLALARHKGVPQDNSPSLDRIDNSRGYVPDNIQVVSFRANKLKNDANLEELEALVAHLRLLRDRGVGFVESGNQT